MPAKYIHRLVIHASFMCLFTCVAGHGLRAEDWHQFLGPKRQGFSSEKGLWTSTKQRLVWMVDGLGAGYASVAVVGQAIYTTGNTLEGQSLICRQVKDGGKVWSTPMVTAIPKHGYEGSRSTPSVDADRVYAIASDGHIGCYSALDGKQVWQRDFADWGGRVMGSWGFSESPLVDGNLVLCTPGGDAGLVVALDKMTGHEVWVSRLPLPTSDRPAGKNSRTGRGLGGGAGYASMVISHGAGIKQYIQLVGLGLVGIRASDGALLWRYDAVANDTANIATPIVDGDYVFASSGYDTGSALLKLKPTTGGGVDCEEVYFLDARTLQNKHGGMVLVDGHVYCGHGNGNGLPLCLELATGKVVWGPKRGPGRGEVSLLHADGHLLWRYEDGLLSVTRASTAGYEEIFQFKPAHQEKKSWSYPALADGRLYLREQDRLMCYELR